MHYNTKQKQAVTELLKSVSPAHLTIEEAEQALKDQGIAVGSTTVYRTLEQLTRDGSVRKYLTGNTPACYQWAEECEREHCYHLICTCCGKLQHLNCEAVDRLFEHIFQEHHFSPDRSRTALYGLCENCRKNNGASSKEL